MSDSIPAETKVIGQRPATPAEVAVQEATSDGRPGYLIRIGTEHAWVSEADADTIGRKLLFD